MKTLRSYVCGSWHEARTGLAPLVNPATEENIAQAGSDGIDFQAVLDHARQVGSPALRSLSWQQRGEILKSMSKVLRENRDELLALSRENSGTTLADGSFDVDGASGTLAYYYSLARTLGEKPFLMEGEATALSKSGELVGQHVLVPRRGVAVHINAFNFPTWGFAEKAACSILAGMPAITKPATATAALTERAIELIVAAGVLPPGALQLVVGSTGDLLDHLEPLDVVAFTGSADTARSLRSRAHLLEANVRFNVEADSLNAAVLAPDVAPGSATFELFVRDVVREISQKTGQKCTAVRRILVPAARLAATREALIAGLGRVVTGNAAAEGVTMGPLATAAQLADSLAGVAELRREAEILFGTGLRSDGVGSPAGKGYFLAPTLLEAADARAAQAIHRREVFAPVATVLPYDGGAGTAAELVALGEGTLVTSAYTDDPAWLGELVASGGSATGRLYVGSEAAAPEAPGSGAALPQNLHGGPGRAGGGEELGGVRGLGLYLQRVALQGSRSLFERI
ncbi:MAG: 3,4-dehydroadipyl-CoA semialdehyde dehydrogenase [Thermoanaerobaculia bacterium]